MVRHKTAPVWIKVSAPHLWEHDAAAATFSPFSRLPIKQLEAISLSAREAASCCAVNTWWERERERQRDTTVKPSEYTLHSCRACVFECACTLLVHANGDLKWSVWLQQERCGAARGGRAERGRAQMKRWAMEGSWGILAALRQAQADCSLHLA